MYEHGSFIGGQFPKAVRGTRFGANQTPVAKVEFVDSGRLVTIGNGNYGIRYNLLNFQAGDYLFAQAMSASGRRINNASTATMLMDESNTGTIATWYHEFDGTETGQDDFIDSGSQTGGYFVVLRGLKAGQIPRARSTDYRTAESTQFRGAAGYYPRGVWVSILTITNIGFLSVSKPSYATFQSQASNNGINSKLYYGYFTDEVFEEDAAFTWTNPDPREPKDAAHTFTYWELDGR